MLLIIDDDPYYTYDLQEYLANVLDYEVLTAITADKGLDLLKDRNLEIDVLILDLMMKPGQEMSEITTKGGMDTGSVIAAVVKQEYPWIKIICSSARFNVTNNGLFDFVLSKPLARAEDVEGILKLIASQKTTAPKASDALKLTPSIAGVGVDLKVLSEWWKNRKHK